MSRDLNYGKQPIEGIRYCARCCFPETLEKIEFDEMGICRSCQSSEQKIHINWKEKEKELAKYSIVLKSNQVITMIV